MKLTFSGHDFILHPSGAMIWPDQGLLIVSDLHLEKSSWYAQQGFFLPPYESHAILKHLVNILRKTGMQRLLLLGDCFHDNGGYARLSSADRAMFDYAMSFDPIWIHGNHDHGFIPEGLKGYDDFKISALTFRHEAIRHMSGEISGHFHPKITLRHKGGLITRSCFIEDGLKMIMPSFGVLTGGLDVQNPAIASHFSSGFKVHIPGNEKFYSVSSAALP